MQIMNTMVVLSGTIAGFVSGQSFYTFFQLDRLDKCINKIAKEIITRNDLQRCLQAEYFHRNVTVFIFSLIGLTGGLIAKYQLQIAGIGLEHI